MSISSTNAVITLTIPLLFPVPVTLLGFAADDVYDTDDIELGVGLIGVDGIASFGFVNALVPQNFHFQADSPSIAIFEAWIAAEKAIQDKLIAQGNTTLTTLGRSFQMVTGGILRGKKMPDAKKTLMPRSFRIDWQDVLPIPVGSAG